MISVPRRFYSRSPVDRTRSTLIMRVRGPADAAAMGEVVSLLCTRISRSSLMGLSPCPKDHELLALVGGGTVPERLRGHLADLRRARAAGGALRAEVAAVRQTTELLPAAAQGELTTMGPYAAIAKSLFEIEPVGESSTSLKPKEPQPRPESIGRYRIVGELDSGGQASVYRAVHPTLPRDLAIKIAHDSSSIDSSLLRSDAAILSELDHPNLVRVYDLDVHEGRPFIAMEFVRGRNLKQVAEQSGPTVRRAAAWMAEVARCSTMFIVAAWCTRTSNRKISCLTSRAGRG